MKVTQEDVVERQVVLQIEMEAEDMEPFLERAYRRLVQRATIPGFRKGKAPRRILESFLGREAILSEAIESLVPEVTAQAVREQQLEQVSPPLVDVVQLDPAILKATVPLTPTVHLDNYRDIRVEEEAVSVTEEQVQEVLEELWRNTAPWEPVERPVQEGDLVTMNVRAVAEGEVLTDQKDVTYLVQQESERPFPGFAGHILGVAPGDAKEFTATVPSPGPEPQADSKEASFTVSVSEIKERRLPAMDDEFAKGVGTGYDSLAALRERVEQDLRTQAERAAEGRFQEKVLETALQGSTVEMPPLLVDHEVEHLLDDQRQALARGGLSMEAYLQAVGRSAEEVRQEMRDQAVRRLTRAWFLNQVAKEEGLEVTPEEVEQEVSRMAEDAGQQPGEAMRQMLADPGTRTSLERLLLTRKAMERLTRFARGQEDGVQAQIEQGEETTREGDAADAE